MDLTPAALRVLGCLIEKEMTTPEYYPLSRNALRVACNQSSNRDPVVDYDDATVEAAVEELRSAGLARRVRLPGQRAEKFKHAAGDVLELGAEESALLAVLALRGPQTPGELRSRTERYVSFDSLGGVEDRLEGLAGRDEALVLRLELRPGQKEHRYAHLLGGAGTPPPGSPPPGPAPRPAESPPAGRPGSAVLRVAAARPDRARLHFAGRLAVETDPADVHADLKAGVGGFVVVDCRDSAAYGAGHIPGAINLHHATIDAATTTALDRDSVLVLYCWGPHCNAATKAGEKLAALGFRVKEMIGGVWGWEQEGYDLVGADPDSGGADG